MAWHTARFVGKVASAGIVEYALPMFANAWLIQDAGRRAGRGVSKRRSGIPHDRRMAGSGAINSASCTGYLHKKFRRCLRRLPSAGQSLVYPRSQTRQYSFSERVLRDWRA